ncbi:carboxynorspermidine decarboxylase [Clostridia bacterium]|nr:carboxynorspermidine decarboxylase [Clostridia bacterium]
MLTDEQIRNLYRLPTPCYVIDEGRLIQNLEILAGVRERTGCKILLAQKAFSCYHLYPLIAQYLDGTTSSGLHEATLAHKYMPRRNSFGDIENHVFAPAYKDDDFIRIAEICNHVVFNSKAQYERHRAASKAHGVSIGLRVNPEIMTQTFEHGMYDPCAPKSRMGIRDLSDIDLSDVEGLHFHTLCEQNSDALEITLDRVIRRYGHLFTKMKWVNFGGGHHITREDYDIPRLERCIRRVTDTGLTVYLEPGEAVALNAGYMVAEILDIVENEVPVAITDASAACHMPDVLEVPYTPDVLNIEKGEQDVRIAGNTCLAGDVIGDYKFVRVPKFGERIVFGDMAIYTMVKNNTFNGIPLPAIGLLTRHGTDVKLLKEFGYDEFERRL